MARLSTANDIMNRVALEIGLAKEIDPFASTDGTFIQLTGLLDSAGQEMVYLHNWQILMKPFSFITSSGDSGTYDLPDDFAAMIDQTGWDHSNRVAIGGPLSAQDWTYLAGRDLISQSIYASFRLVDNKLDLYPQDPVPDGLDINFEYISRNWLTDNAGENPHDTIAIGSDIVLFPPILMIKFLKVKMLSAKGFDANDAKLEFENMFNSLTGRDEGAPILSASNHSRGFPYLHPYYNTSDTGYGVP